MRKNNLPGPGPGRPPGSKDSIPGSVRSSIKALFEELGQDHPETYRRAIEKGLRASPRDSYRFVQLAASYLDGRPHEHITVERSGAPSQVELSTMRQIHKEVEAQKLQDQAQLRERLKANTISRDDLEVLARPSLDLAKLSRDELADLARTTVESSPWNLRELADEDEPEADERASVTPTPKRNRAPRKK